MLSLVIKKTTTKKLSAPIIIIPLIFFPEFFLLKTKRSFVVLRGYLRFQFYFSIVNFQSVRGLNPGYGHLVSCQVAK